ncbi:MAG: hypothetical protein ACM3SQ_02005 [Betaproteobacteria bacterium]
MKPLARTLLATVLAVAAACAPPIRRTIAQAPTPAQLAELWQEPKAISAREVTWGPWGRRLAPDGSKPFRFVKRKTHGRSPGYHVVDAEGVEWSVKEGTEAGVEVAVSRILSALGYRQPPVYYLPRWTLTGRRDAAKHQGPARFRPKLPEIKERGDWSWQQNPFVGTEPYGGLLALMLMLNETDLKNSNNSLYEVTSADGRKHRWYVVRDLGSALGETGRMNPKGGDPELFARLGFVTGVHDGRVAFAYHGLHQELAHQLTPADLHWMVRLASRLSDEQWAEAFRAGGFSPQASNLYVRRINEKMAQARSVSAR